MGVLFCKGNNIHGTIRNMYPLAENRHDVLLQCHGNCIEVKIIHYLLEIDIFNSAQKIGVQMHNSPDWTTLIPLSPGAQSIRSEAQKFLVAVV